MAAFVKSNSSGKYKDYDRNSPTYGKEFTLEELIGLGCSREVEITGEGPIDALKTPVNSVENEVPK